MCCSKLEGCCGLTMLSFFLFLSLCRFHLILFLITLHGYASSAQCLTIGFYRFAFVVYSVFILTSHRHSAERMLLSGSIVFALEIRIVCGQINGMKGI